MKQLTKEDIALLRYAFRIYMFETGSESEEDILLMNKLNSLYIE